MKSVEKKTRYSDIELQEFKALIKEKLATGQKQLDFYLQQLNASGNNADSKVKGLDDGIGTRENEQVSRLAARQRKIYST